MSEDKNVNKKSFWKGMKSELKKVIWPTGEQTVKSTFATIAFVIMVSLVLIVFNYIFNALSSLWIRGLSHEDVIENVVISSGEANASENAEVISGETVSDTENNEETVEETNEIAEPVDEANEDNETAE